MGVNSLITWAVIDPVMRAVITETRALGLAFCPLRWCLRNASFKFFVKLHVRRGLWTPRLGTAIILGLGFQLSRLGPCSDVETRVSTLASWCCTEGMTSPASGVWILLFDDLSSVIFRQPTRFFVQRWRVILIFHWQTEFEVWFSCSRW